MSCPEVVYQAYYPYLYQRPGTSAASRPPPPPHFYHHHPHYERDVWLNDERLKNRIVWEEDSEFASKCKVVSGRTSEDSGNEASPSVYTRQPSLTPPSPPQAHRSVYTDEDDDSAQSSRAQYVSANCVVFTHYTGDVAAVVDEHFTRALSTDTKPPQSTKDWSPMTSRNFPPSFWNSNSSSSSSGSTTETGYHGTEPAAMYHCATPSEPWHSHYQQYHHHRAVHEYHQANMQYGGGLLLPAHQYKEAASWHSQHRLHDPTAHHLDPGAYYPAISGLEPQVQEGSKDLYWF